MNNTNYREPQMNVRIYLSVPFNDKNKAKDLGCRWDPDRKKWYAKKQMLYKVGLVNLNTTL